MQYIGEGALLNGSPYNHCGGVCESPHTPLQTTGDVAPVTRSSYLGWFILDQFLSTLNLSSIFPKFPFDDPPAEHCTYNNQ